MGSEQTTIPGCNNVWSILPNKHTFSWTICFASLQQTSTNWFIKVPIHLCSPTANHRCSLPRYVVKMRLWGKQPDPRKGPKWSASMPWAWTCPIHTCGLVIKGTYSGVSQARYFHVRSKHPEVDPSFFHSEPPDVPVATSPDIPKAQRAWSCPLCSHGLPALSLQVKKRAVRAHCAAFHPKETMRSLCNLNRKGVKNNGVSVRLKKGHQAGRLALFSTHTIVPVECVEKKLKDPNWRGQSYYCSKCFSQLRGRTAHKADMSCQDRQAELRSNGWVRSRKRAWWNSWLANEPQTAQSFLKNYGLTQEEISATLNLDSVSGSSRRWKNRRTAAGFEGVGKAARLVLKTPAKARSKVSKSQTKVSKAQGAAWRHGGSRGVRVGEARHPGPLSVSCLNTRGDQGAWDALKLGQQPDIWLLQETWLTDSKATAFRRFAYSKGFVAYTQNGAARAGASQTGCGGVAVLVRRGLSQKFGAQFSKDDCQGIFVWVQGLFVGSLYAPPHEHCPQIACAGFIDAMVAANVKPTNKWFIGGDFNETPSDGLFSEVMPAIGGSISGLGKPTRFEGNREIDFFCSNCAEVVGGVTSPDMVLSDHRILETTVEIPVMRPFRGVIPKGPRFTCPSDCSSDAWRDRLSSAWGQAKEQLGFEQVLADSGKSVQEKWDHFQATLRCCFLTALHAPLAPVRRSKYKGAVASVRQETMPASGNFVPMRERKLRHRLARWYELSRLRTKYYTDELSASQRYEFQQLTWKLTGSFAIPSRQTIRATLVRLQTDLGQLRDQTKNSNLMSWRTKLQSCSSHVSKWLRSKEWSMCSGVIRNDGKVTENGHEGSEAIKAFWESFWSDLRRSIPSFSQREAALLHGVPAPAQAVNIPFPTGLELQATAQDSHGAAGPDNWTAQELKYLPLDVFNTVSELFRAFATARDVPKQLRQSRMVCLPKEGEVHDYSIKDGDARPISVMSVWWRLWSSSICRSTSLRSWLRSVLLANVGGVSREDIYENIIEIFDNFHKHGFMLAMDYSKAFDCLDSNLSCSLLRAHGWPLDLIHLLEATWRQQERFVQWDHHTHSSTLDASHVQPQGDPWGPLIMSLWVQAGVQTVLQTCETPESDISIKTYLDDRSCTARNATKLHEIYLAWSQWSSSVGLCENLAKCEVSAVGKRKTEDACQVFDPSRVSPAIRVLGAVSCSVRRAYRAAEVRRFEAARKCARLLGCCSFSLPLQLRYLRQFSLSKVNFGWVARAPTWTSSKQLWSCFWSSVRRCRYSSPWLRCLFLGGNLHLDVVWATRLLSAVFRYHLSKGSGPVWSRLSGTASNALRSWMKAKGFSEVRPWVWQHTFAAVTVDASLSPSRHTLPSLSGAACHALRQGWRAWVFQEWASSGRHEISSLPSLTSSLFRSIQIDDVRSWVLSSAPAASVGLGATFSPATWDRVSGVGQSSLCPWGCQSAGFWDHLCWSCSRRPAHAPDKPACAFLARFGWTLSTNHLDPTQVTKVRGWLTECQSAIWSAKDH